jgi:hypothetical protein
LAYIDDLLLHTKDHKKFLEILFGATLHLIEKTWIEDQPAKILLRSSGGQLFGVQADAPRDHTGH